MDNEERFSVNFPTLVIRRPFSVITGVLAGIVIILALFLRLHGNTYIGQLNWIDAFTPVMIGVLLIRGIFRLRQDTDLQAVSISLTCALSFVFIYEAIYKLSFYVFPWLMPPYELRDFTIQIGITLTALVGFAFGRFRISKLSSIFLSLFILLYTIWLLSGFPQVDNSLNVLPVYIPIHYTWNFIYGINRGTKVLMFLVYFFFYSESSVLETSPSPSSYLDK